MKKLLRNLPLLLLALAVAGCASTSPKSSFYILTAVADPAVVPISRPVTIGVGPIRLASHLEREQIVARAGSNSLEIDEFQRWGGNLERNVSDVVAENLSRLLGVDGVLVSPWSSTIDIDYQVALDIRSLERVDSQKVRLVAQWRLFRGDGEKLLQVKRTVIDEPVGGPGFDAQAAAESRALAKLSAEIAAAIRGREAG